MFVKKTVEDIDLEGKTVLLRADYNVPLDGDKIADDYRIKQSLQTIEYLLSKNVKLIICSHLGRPDGKKNLTYSLFPVAKRLKELLKKDVEFVPDCIGDEVTKAVSKLDFGQVLLLENLRFHIEEEQNSAEFARQLASVAEIFVQDGFGVVHRAHASTEAITHFLPSVAGFLLKKEVDTITEVMLNPKRPLMAVIGGAKIADKIDLIHKFIELADQVAIGGAMANTFLMSQGFDVGSSLYDRSELPIARDIIRKAASQSKKRKFSFILPFDVVVSKKIDSAAPIRIVDILAHSLAEIESYPKRPNRSSGRVEKDELILDIGPFSGAFIAGTMQSVSTVVWNGTLGVTETKSLLTGIGPYSHGTNLLVRSIAGEFGHRPYSLVGGGDTVSYLSANNLMNLFNHVSTGGGASLELMAGRKLPGVEALENK